MAKIGGGAGGGQKVLDKALGSAKSFVKFSPDRFRAVVTLGAGLAPSNKFEVVFPDIQGMRKLNGDFVNDYTTTDMRSVMCTAAQMPGKAIQVTERGIGHDRQAMATSYATGPVNFSFLLTNTYNMKNYFEEWMDCIVNHGVNEPQYTGYYDNYAKDKTVVVRQNSRNGRRDYAVKLYEAYPIGINAIDFQNSTAQVMEVTVTMNYRYYEAIREHPLSDPADFIESIAKKNPFK